MATLLMCYIVKTKLKLLKTNEIFIYQALKKNINKTEKSVF